MHIAKLTALPLLSLALAACGGGWGYDDLSVADFDYPVAQAYADAIYGDREYHLTGTDGQSNQYDLRVTVQNHGPESVDGVDATRVERRYTVTNLTSGGQVSYLETTWYDASDNPVHAVDSDGVETAFHSWQTVPGAARTGSAGGLYAGDSSDGSRLEASWYLDKASQFQALFGIETIYRDTAGAEIGLEDIVFEIHVATGALTLREIVVRFPNEAVTVVFR